MCIAFGYSLPTKEDLTTDSLDFLANRKARMAFDLEHGKFESMGKPSDPYYYEVMDRSNLESRAREGYVNLGSFGGRGEEMTTELLSRTRKYESYNWKEMTAWCTLKKNAGRYPEHEKWRRMATNLRLLKNKVALRDYLIKTKKYVIGKGPVIREIDKEHPDYYGGSSDEAREYGYEREEYYQG